MPLDEKRKFGKRNHFDRALRREESIGDKVDSFWGTQWDLASPKIGWSIAGFGGKLETPCVGICRRRRAGRPSSIILIGQRVS